MQRPPLTTTHPHGHVIARTDRSVGLVRISKSASTESKVRLDCSEWIAFDEFDGPVVAFVREPFARFISSMPETVLRMTHFQQAESDRKDRVEIPEDIHHELAAAASAPIADFARLFLDLVEYAFFDAHHEPQVSFVADRQMRLRIDPWLYPTEEFERAISQIEARLGIACRPPGPRSNKGGAKPLAGRNAAVDMARRVTRTGVYRRVRHAGVLGLRYRGDGGPIDLRQLNELANRFTAELKSCDLAAGYRERVLGLYAADLMMWQAVRDAGGDVKTSEVWPVSDAG